MVSSPILGVYCGTSIPPSHISSSNKILIHFQTDDIVTKSGGFRMEYNPYDPTIPTTCQGWFGWIGDGYCDDINNNVDCTFDGGDCCGGIIDPTYCTECLCLEGGGGSSVGTTTPSGTTSSGGCNQFIGDGYCDDNNNNLACTYDGGDCCGSNVNIAFCTECICLEGGSGGSGGTTTPLGTTTGGGCNEFIGDRFCDDINNNLACTYDGGDCCLSNINTAFCTECQCLEEGGTTTGKGCNQFIGDGYCDDINNNLACTYDGGDCCRSNVNTAFCIVFLCLEGGGGGSSGSTTPSGTANSGGCNLDWITDGYCDDINNHLACNYDGGDCCGTNVNTQYCSDCQCLE